MKFWIIKGLRSLKVRYPCASKTQIIAENEKKINAKLGQQNLDFSKFQEEHSENKIHCHLPFF